jgi:acyl carrier protein
MRQDTFERVCTVLADQQELDRDELYPQTHLTRDLPLDELDVMEIQMALEEEFQQDIPDEAWQQLQGGTLEALSDYLDALMAGSPADPDWNTPKVAGFAQVYGASPVGGPRVAQTYWEGQEAAPYGQVATQVTVPYGQAYVATPQTVPAAQPVQGVPYGQAYVATPQTVRPNPPVYAEHLPPAPRAFVTPTPGRITTPCGATIQCVDEHGRPVTVPLG